MRVELRLVRHGPGGRMRQIHVGDAALILARPRSLFESSGNAKLRTAIDRVRARALEEAP